MGPKSGFGEFEKDIDDSIMLGVPVAVGARTASLTDPDVGLPSWRLRPNIDRPNQHMCTSDTAKHLSDCQKPTMSKFHSLWLSADGRSVIDLGHWIAVVGYDPNNYYYIDTFGQGTFNGVRINGRIGPTDDDKNYWHPGPGDFEIPHVWSITKPMLWELVSQGSRGAWLKYALVNSSDANHTHDPW
jgi:hypothetical protein